MSYHHQYCLVLLGATADPLQEVLREDAHLPGGQGVRAHAGYCRVYAARCGSVHAAAVAGWEGQDRTGPPIGLGKVLAGQPQLQLLGSRPE